MTTVIHVIEKVSLGGGTRGVLASAKYSSRLDPRVKHEIISLLPPKPDAMAMAHKIGVVVYPKPNRSEIYEILNTADIVQVDWWNSPAMTAFLNKELPASRLVIWFHVAGDKAPQIIMPDLLNLPDVAVATSWYNYDVISALQKEQSTSKTTIDMVFCGTDFERFDSLHLKQHQGFNVGYIGTVDFVKLHQNYMLMSASVDIPDIKFIVCGREIEPGTIDSL